LQRKRNIVINSANVLSNNRLVNPSHVASNLILIPEVSHGVGGEEESGEEENKIATAAI
jgi:hypothetical protein